MKDGGLRVAWIVGPGYHETDVVASVYSRCLDGVCVMNGKGSPATRDIVVFRTENREGFQPEIMPGASITRDIADVLELLGDGVVDDETVEDV